MVRIGCGTIKKIFGLRRFGLVVRADACRAIGPGFNPSSFQLCFLSMGIVGRSAHSVKYKIALSCAAEGD